MLKVSVIVPVKNEASSIAVLLDALLSQSRLPDEIVITDGGSTDNTVQIINSYAKKNDFIRLICLPHAFAGKGRNTSIAHSKNNIIASIDAGCVPAQNWLEELIEPFEKDSSTDIVYGMYRPMPKTLLEKCFVLTTEPIGFTISVVSMAHKKEVWEKVEGYPENLRTVQDTVFLSKIKREKFKVQYKSSAIVYWQPRSTILGFFKQFYWQSKTNGYLGLRKMFYIRKIAFVSLVLVFLIAGTLKNHMFLLIVALLYIAWIFIAVVTHYDWFKQVWNKPKAYLIIPATVIARDMSQICGFFSGVAKRIKERLIGHSLP
ncbi:MAG: glycosyltransferase [Candidatus Omnitrophica bacterium]|nr:glycosyltransferase [Candidatus Omnitrophota bacterium]